MSKLISYDKIYKFLGCLLITTINVGNNTSIKNLSQKNPKGKEVSFYTSVYSPRPIIS